MKHYIIGDVHGQYHTLLALVAKLPKDAKLIFVGDLIDRGYFSKEVVDFVRKGNHLCVMGNHEELMIDHIPYLFNAYEEDRSLDLYSTWFSNGGTNTLLSYDVIQLVAGRIQKIDNYQEAIAHIKDDIAWMKELPLYLRLDIPHPSKKSIVISHACVGAVWKHHDSEKGEQTFKEYALWNRKTPPKDMPIFNIFGHTPVEFGVEIEESYVNVDTGCYINQHGYAMLSAYCVESGEVLSIYRVDEDKKV